MSIVEADPSLAIQAAMVAALRADATLTTIFGGEPTVYDNVSAETYPFIRVGEDKIAPDDMECGSSTEIFSTVRVYSQAVGKVEAKTIAGRVRFVLTKRNSAFDAALEAEGFRFVYGHCQSIDYEEHADGRTTQAMVDFNYRIEPVGP